MEEKRKYHYDILRILAAFSVVMLHSAAQYWYDLDIRSTQWVVANSYNAISRFGVPIFVMISGAIFLDKSYELNIKKLYKHNILRLVILYIVWSVIYGLYDCRTWDIEVAGIKAVLKEMLLGRYHLWFIPMIVGFYILLPVFKSFVDHANKKTIEYFLWVFFALQICSETVRALTINDELHYILDLLKVEMACGYIGYFILGYYLAHIGIGDKLKKILYGMFVPASVANIVLGCLLSFRANERLALIYDSFGLFTFIMTVVLFTFICDKGKKRSVGTKTGKLLKELSANTMGVYVMHIGVMEITKGCEFQSVVGTNIIGIPLYAVMCFVLCALAAAILRRIPFIGRFIC